MQFILPQQPVTFIFFGKSGCGKGTQAHKLLELFGTNQRKSIYIETGAEVRSLAQQDTYMGKRTGEIINTGDFLPSFVPVWAWSNRFMHEYTGVEDLILDGLCRKYAEAPVLDSALKFFGRNTVFIVHINVTRGWSIDRLLKRGRADDTPERIEHRLSAFEHEVPMVLDYFRERKGYGYVEVNGEQTIDQVYEEMIGKLGGTSFLC